MLAEVQRQLFETQEKLRSSLEHIDLLTSEFKEAQKQQEEHICQLTQQLHEEKVQNNHLADQRDGAYRRYSELLQGWSTMYPQKKRRGSKLTATTGLGLQQRK